ncbi:MAG: agmatinase [Phycisphaerae bacterium]|jgi:agmatinase
MADTVPDNFLGLAGRDADYRRARYAVLPIPYEATTTYGIGTRDGPRAILTASQQVELYDEALGRSVPRSGVATLEPLEADARGPAEMVQRVYRAARRVLRDGKFLISLGGEHSITAGLVRAVRQQYRDLCVLQIDAHADLRDEYQGSPHSHACVMRRVHEMGVSVVGVGIRNYSAGEARFIRTAKPALFSARHCHEQPGWIDDVVAALGQHVYLTIDLDGFDPACAPGTGTPEPGGLTWFQVTDLLAAVARKRQIVAVDCVEVRPLPGNNVTEFLAARLIHHLLGLLRA